jgi:hypothetical protein
MELLIAAAFVNVLVGDRVDVCRLDFEVEVGDLLFVKVPEFPVCCTVVDLSAPRYDDHSAGIFCRDWLLFTHAVEKSAKKARSCEQTCFMVCLHLAVD